MCNDTYVSINTPPPHAREEKETQNNGSALTLGSGLGHPPHSQRPLCLWLTLGSRATLVQGMNLSDLVAQFRLPQTDLDHYTPSGGDHVVVLAVFDHDHLGAHLLLQSCHTGPVADFLGMNRWEFSLWHLGDSATLVHYFLDAEHTPWAEAAALVEHWSKHGHYNGETNGLDPLLDDR